MYTYSEIVQILKDVVTAHKRVKSHYHDETQRPDNITYPVVHSRALPFVGTDLGLTIPIEIAILDRPNEVNRTQNEIEIVSRCTQVAFDLISYFKATKFNQPLDVDLNYTIEPAQDTQEDEVSGVKFVLNLTLVADYNICAIPMDGVPVDENANVAFVVNQDGDILARLRVNQRYTVTEIKRIIDTILTNVVTVTDNIIP